MSLKQERPLQLIRNTTIRMFYLFSNDVFSYLKEHMPKEVPLVFEDNDSFWIPIIGKDEKTGEMK